MHLMTNILAKSTMIPSEVLSFPNGIFGFEEEKQFLLLPFHGAEAIFSAFRALAPLHLLL